MNRSIFTNETTPIDLSQLSGLLVDARRRFLRERKTAVPSALPELNP